MLPQRFFIAVQPLVGFHSFRSLRRIEDIESSESSHTVTVLSCLDIHFVYLLFEKHWRANSQSECMNVERWLSHSKDAGWRIWTVRMWRMHSFIRKMSPSVIHKEFCRYSTMRAAHSMDWFEKRVRLLPDKHLQCLKDAVYSTSLRSLVVAPRLCMIWLLFVRGRKYTYRSNRSSDY